MANKLTDALAALSEKTKSVENKIAAARVEAAEKLEARIAESKAELAAKKEKFISTAANVKANAAGNAGPFKDEINQKVEHLKAEVSAKKETVKHMVEEKKQEFDVVQSEKKYHDALTNADNSVDFAMIALGEVETATLEAFAAKSKLEDLQKQNA